MHPHPLQLWPLILECVVSADAEAKKACPIERLYKAWIANANQ